MSCNKNNCDDVQSDRGDECSCSCAPIPKKAYQPDTTTPEIDRKIQEAKEQAYECQRIWQKAKNAPAPGFDEPPPLQFPGTCPPQPVPIVVPQPDDKDKKWCQKLSKIVKPVAVSLVQNKVCGNEAPAVPISCPTNPPPPSSSSENCDCVETEDICAAGSNKNKEPENSCEFAEAGRNKSSEDQKEKPDASECQKFLNYAKGLTTYETNRPELYDPRNKDKARDNIKSCMYLGSGCFEAFDETAALMNKKECNCNCQVEKESCDTQRVKSVPQGCCDYRKTTGKTDRFVIPEEYDCPPFPDSEVELLVMPPWFECPSESSVAPYPAPVGAKVKPISKGGIRTNFERNPYCLCCGAKRKDPFKKKCMKDLNQNCPAMKTRCSSKSVIDKKDNSFFKQIKNAIGITW